MNPWHRITSIMLFLSVELLASELSGHTSQAQQQEEDIHYRLAISSMTFNAEGTMLATTAGWIVGIWSVNTGTKVREIKLQPSNGSIIGLSFSQDSKFLYGGSADGKLITWDVETGTEVASIATKPSDAKPYTFLVGAAAFSHNKRLFANGTHSGDVHIWETSTGKPVARLGGSHGQIRTLAFNRDDSLLAVGDSGGLILIWNLKTRGQPIALYGATTEGTLDTPGWIYSVLFSDDGKTVLSSGFHPGVLIWNLSTAKQISSIGPDYDWVETMDLSPDGQHLLTSSKNNEDRDPKTKMPRSHRIAFWDLRSSSQVSTFPGTISVFSPDGKMIAVSEKQQVTFSPTPLRDRRLHDPQPF